jgi:uncharacterized membrane protein
VIGPGHRGALMSAALLLGVGLGGFLDGIVLHQILQWHSMLSTRVPATDVVAIKYNMVWDGLFHAFTWITTVVGIGLLWRAGTKHDVPWSTSTFVGCLFLGWGAFNVVEGVIDHHILSLHHVHPGVDQIVWDVGFLLFGAALVGIGYVFIASGRRDETPRGAARAWTPPHSTEVARSE